MSLLSRRASGEGRLTNASGERTAPPTLFDLWKATNEGCAPAFFSLIFRRAFDHLESGLTPGAVALDVGCGTGHVTAALAGFGCRAAGFDIDAPTVLQGREAHPAEVLFVGDAQNIPLADQSVDAIFSFSVFQYLDRSRALAECARVLRPNGRFAIIENLQGNPFAKLFRAQRRLSSYRYPKNLAPLRHTRWDERRDYEAHFSDVHYEAHYLLTPLFLLFRSMWADDSADHALARRVFPRLNAIERALISRIPLTRDGCWSSLTYGRR